MPGKRLFFGLVAAIFVFVSALASPLASQAWRSLGPEGGNAVGLVRDPHNSRLIYTVLSPGGVFKSVDAGVNWTFAGQGIPTDIALGGLAIDPNNSSVLYVAADRIYKSTNGGGSWTPLSLYSGYPLQRVAVSPFDSSVLISFSARYAYRSLDGGATWANIRWLSDINMSFGGVAFDPLHTGVVFLGVKAGGLLKSTDNGTTWAQISSEVQPVDLLFDPNQPGVLFAVHPYRGVYRSATGGDDWTLSNEGMLNPYGGIDYPLTCIAPGPAGSGYYYVGSTRGSFRSHDGLQSWGQQSMPGLPSYNAMLVDPTNKEYVLAATSPLGLCRSLNAGSEWVRSSDGLSSVYLDASTLAIIPSNPAEILIGTRRGIYKSANRGASWQLASLEFDWIQECYSIAPHPTNPSILFASAFWGILKSTDGGKYWWLSNPNDGPRSGLGIRSIRFDPFNPDTIYAAGPNYPGFFRIVNGGADWTFPANSPSINALEVDRNQPNVLYAALASGWPDLNGPPGWYIAKSIDGGSTWTGLAGDFFYYYANAVVVDPTSSLRIYFAGKKGFYKTENGGASWRRIQGQLGSEEIYSLAIDPQNPSTLYAAAENTVLRSTDRGETWAVFGTGLPADQYVCLAVDPADATIVYAGSGGTGGLFRTGGMETPILRVDRDIINIGVLGGGRSSSGQDVRISNDGSGTLHWTAFVEADCTFVRLDPSSGTGNASLHVGVDPAAVPPGDYNVQLTIQDPGAERSPRTIRVQIKRYNSGGNGPPQPPFGTFDTPEAGATVSSSIAVTGWALDDCEVMGVKIYRDPVDGEPAGRKYIGDATFVDGARPDIEMIYRDYPFHFRAGWGYMLLTNFLPNSGNGIFTLRAYATDMEGNEILLGSKTITCDNAHAVKPFGAIDLPAQGEMIYGAGYINGGWGLTPPPNAIPTDGSTMGVWVDSVWVGRPSYNNYRGDIATLFPGYANSNGAVGVFTLDTTAYANGVHTIEWSVRDNAGNEDGIGSRYFSILNTGTPTLESLRGPLTKLSDLAGYRDITLQPVYTRRGYDRIQTPKQEYAVSGEELRLEIRELERVEILLDEKAWSADAARRTAERAGLKPAQADAPSGRPGSRWEGYQIVGEKLRPLPIGSTLDASMGIFSWSPGPGFLGDYRLVFIDRENNSRELITIRIGPKFTATER